MWLKRRASSMEWAWKCMLQRFGWHCQVQSSNESERLFGESVQFKTGRFNQCTMSSIATSGHTLKVAKAWFQIVILSSKIRWSNLSNCWFLFLDWHHTTPCWSVHHNRCYTWTSNTATVCRCHIWSDQNNFIENVFSVLHMKFTSCRAILTCPMPPSDQSVLWNL